MRPRKFNRPLLDRFMDLVMPEPNTGCWLWVGNVDVGGYGRMRVEYRLTYAHRMSFSLFRKSIPAGFVVDHVCRVRSCVNPDHLRLATPRENTLENSCGLAAKNLKKTHCCNGHEFSDENIYRSDGRQHRRCVACTRSRNREHYQRRKMQVAA